MTKSDGVFFTIFPSFFCQSPTTPLSDAIMPQNHIGVNSFSHSKFFPLPPHLPTNTLTPFPPIPKTRIKRIPFSISIVLATAINTELTHKHRPISLRFGWRRNQVHDQDREPRGYGVWVFFLCLLPYLIPSLRRTTIKTFWIRQRVIAL